MWKLQPPPPPPPPTKVTPSFPTTPSKLRSCQVPSLFENMVVGSIPPPSRDKHKCKCMLRICGYFHSGRFVYQSQNKCFSPIIFLQPGSHFAQQVFISWEPCFRTPQFFATLFLAFILFNSTTKHNLLKDSYIHISKTYYRYLEKTDISKTGC